MKTLLASGVNLYAGDIRNMTALHYAAFNCKLIFLINILEYKDAVHLLCEHDADFEKLRKI